MGALYSLGMHDLPTVTVQQQAHARPISGEDLEVMGKAAASAYHCGEYGTLDEAVVETVKKAGLSPEQVKRVVEFTNVNAHQMAFKKEADHKVIEFQGGPADPGNILRELNDGGGGTVFDRGSSDYNYPPPDVEKTSSANMDRFGLDDAKLASAFSAPAGDELSLETKERAGGEYGFADPFREAMDLRDKLASARDYLNHELSAMETVFLDAGDLLYNEVKQASLEGTPLGQVVQAWSSVTEEPAYVKLAFQALTPRLLQEEIFPDKDELSQSITSIDKTAGLVNHEHPLVGTFVDYCDTLFKLAELRQARDECDQHFDAITSFIKQAQGGLVGRAAGLIPKVVGLAERASVPAGKAGKAVGEVLFGPGAAAEAVGKGVGGAVKYTPHAAGALAFEEAYQRARYNPVVQGGKNILMARIPYTHQNLIRHYSMQH